MSYVPNTQKEREEMLAEIGVKSVRELFEAIPADALIDKLNLPEAKSEFEVMDELGRMSAENTVYKTCFRGAGAYRHYIPSVVKHLSSREEFVTAYTPYQAEMSQGVLQVIFEYQTTICELTGMQAANASVYDGAHAAAEAAAMFRDAKRPKTVISAAVKPNTLKTVQTYCNSSGSELVIVPAKNGVTDIQALKAALDSQTAGVYIEQPNFFGMSEPVEEIEQAVHAAGAKLIMGCYPIALALMKTPGEYGADAAVGEAQPLGMPLSFGGPYLGFMATTAANMRKLPGRIVGKTQDKNGETAYVLTLQAREQHIRREKASSSICSNEALCALTATIYCAAMGREGIREVAAQCHSKAVYAAEKISAVKGFKKKYDGFFFNEFVTACPVEPDALQRKLDSYSILGAQTLEDGNILWCVTECNTKDEIDSLVCILEEVVK